MKVIGGKLLGVVPEKTRCDSLPWTGTRSSKLPWLFVERVLQVGHYKVSQKAKEERLQTARTECAVCRSRQGEAPHDSFESARSTHGHSLGIRRAKGKRKIQIAPINRSNRLPVRLAEGSVPAKTLANSFISGFVVWLFSAY